MNLNNDNNNNISIVGIINSNSSSSSIGSTTSNSNSSSNSSSCCNSISSIENNNSNSENVIKPTVNHSDQNNINFNNHIICNGTGGGGGGGGGGNDGSSAYPSSAPNGCLSKNLKQRHAQLNNNISNNKPKILNTSLNNNINNNNNNNNSSIYSLHDANSKSENQNFNISLQQKQIDTTQKMPQLVATQQQPKPLSANNFNFFNNENAKNGFDPYRIQPPRAYKRKFTCLHENKIECTSECDQGAGLKRDKKNEYARQQMRKYREKIKSDPIRYMKYLQTERERNAKRKYRKMEKLIKEEGVANPEEILKIQKREANRLYRERCRTNPTHQKIRTSTQQRLLKSLIEKLQNGEYKLPENFSLPDNMLQNLENMKSETFKDESMSDSENIIEQDDGITDSENSHDYIDCTDDDDDSKSDDGFIFPSYNRICAVVNCPSRYCNDGVEYFPLPTQKNIRDLWIRQIKIHCQQWEINPNAFICSLHFSLSWFESKLSEKDFLSKAVPTLFPNASASQFDIDIPEMEDKDFESQKCAKHFYKWSKDKMKEQESLLKHQHSILENQSEMNFLQKLKITSIISEINEFKSKYLFAEDVKKDLDNIFDQIRGISMNFPN